jgi:hypothetical protein
MKPVHPHSGAQKSAWRLWIAAGAAALLAACATQTPYGPRDVSGYGFSETRIEADRYRVSFLGNSLTDRETVETYLLYRAAELTLQNGYDWFEIVDRDTESDRRIRRSPSAIGSPFYYSYFHPYYGWIPAYDPFWADRDYYRESTRYQASAEVRMGSGEKPEAGNAYSAREVQMNLAGAIAPAG